MFKFNKFNKIIKPKYILRYCTNKNSSKETPRKISDNIKEIYRISTNNFKTIYFTFKQNRKEDRKYFSESETKDKIGMIWFGGFILTFIGVSIKMIMDYDPRWKSIIDIIADVCMGICGAAILSVIWPLLYIACALKFFKKRY